MERLQPVIYENLSEEQQRVYDLICATRDKTLGGPHLAFIYFPQLEILQQATSNILRTNTRLKKPQFEMLTLIAARNFDVAYMWGVHERDGALAGLSQDVMDAINHREEPKFDDEQDKIMYEIASIVVKGGVVPQDKFDKAVELLGMDYVVEVITDVAYYAASAVTINTFNIKPRPGTPAMYVG